MAKNVNGAFLTFLTDKVNLDKDRAKKVIVFNTTQISPPKSKLNLTNMK